MEEQIKKLRDAGFSDADIQEWMDEQKNKQGIAANEQVTEAVKPAEQDVPFKMETTAVAPENNMATNVATGVAGLGNVSSGDLARYGAEAYAAKKLIYDPAKQLVSKVANRMAPPAGAVPPVGSPGNPIGGTATGAAQGAAGAGESTAARAPGMLSRVAPYLETAGRVASRVAGPAALALTPSTLNAGEDQQMAQIRKVQDSIGKMAPAQQSMYFTLPANKRQQVNQMIMNGQDPSGLLVPNAVNTDFPNSALQRR